MIRMNVSPPMSVTVREDDVVVMNGISEIEFEELAEGQAAPKEALVASCHKRLVNAAGDPVPIGELRSLDLEGGIRRAFRNAFEARRRT